jgi:DNA-binding SARP family transcriptional activator
MERSAPREKLAALLWPEVDEARARHRLNQSIYALRQSIGNDSIFTKAEEVGVAADVTIDARDFGTLADVGEYDRALELYQRPFLDGFYVDGADEWERWVDRKRAVLERTYTHALRAQLRDFTHAQKWNDVMRTATRWLEHSDTSDDASHGLMLALASTGRVADALAHFEMIERKRREDDGERVSAQLRELSDAIRAGRIGTARGPDLSDLGRPLRYRIRSGATSFGCGWSKRVGRSAGKTAVRQYRVWIVHRPRDRVGSVSRGREIEYIQCCREGRHFPLRSTRVRA